MNFNNKTPLMEKNNFAISLQACLPATNDSFCKLFERQMKTMNIKSAQPALVQSINDEINKIKRNMTGTQDVVPPPNGAESEPSEDEEPFQLLPRSQWVYTTPDKQRLKKMEELSFNESPVFEPAVLHHNKKMKTVYEIDEVAQNCVDLNLIRSGQEVPIDLDFLKPVCSLREGDGNNFLEQVEETLCIENVLHIDRSEGAKVIGGHICMKRQNSSNALDTWYDKRMKILATCRPQKATVKMDRLSYLNKKSLSFHEAGSNSSTPVSHSYRKGRFISMDEFESGVSRLEHEFSDALYAETADLSLHEEPSASPELSAIFTGVIPPYKFYNKNE